jgi:electron transport complex protein RnfC
MFCPTKLMPYRLMELAQRGDLETAEKEHLKDCILCGSCSYVCPSRRWLAPSIKNAKERLQRRS